MFKSLLIKFCHLIFLIVVGNIISWKDLKEDNVLWLLAPVDDISRAGIPRDPVFLITLGLIGRQPPVVIKLSHSEGDVCRAAPSHSALSSPHGLCRGVGFIEWHGMFLPWHLVFCVSAERRFQHPAHSLHSAGDSRAAWGCTAWHCCSLQMRWGVCHLGHHNEALTGSARDAYLVLPYPLSRYESFVFTQHFCLNKYYL